MAYTLRGVHVSAAPLLDAIARAQAAARRDVESASTPECVDCGDPARIRSTAGPSCGQFGCPTERISPVVRRARAGQLPATDITGTVPSTR